MEPNTTTHISKWVIGLIWAAIILLAAVCWWIACKVFTGPTGAIKNFISSVKNGMRDAMVKPAIAKAKEMANKRTDAELPDPPAQS